MGAIACSFWYIIDAFNLHLGFFFLRQLAHKKQKIGNESYLPASALQQMRVQLAEKLVDAEQGNTQSIAFSISFFF